MEKHFWLHDLFLNLSIVDLFIFRIRYPGEKIFKSIAFISLCYNNLKLSGQKYVQQQKIPKTVKPLVLKSPEKVEN